MPPPGSHHPRGGRSWTSTYCRRQSCGSPSFLLELRCWCSLTIAASEKDTDGSLTGLFDPEGDVVMETVRSNHSECWRASKW
mmetsp:Transcript_28582/g.58899  ORF Transcript_28582/g.58899 Transcript_28582/m.58899 type:complete len:82 (+) Transcript_28582:1163-1408(+)